LTGVDVFILLVLLASILIGLMRGFIRECVALVFWIIGIWAAWTLGPLVEPHLGGLLAGPQVRPWIARLLVLIAVLLAGALVGLLLGFLMRSAGMGPIDRVLGVLFGLLRGMVLVGVLVIGGELLHLNHEAWWGQSKLIPYGETIGDWLRRMVGEKGEPWARLERLSGFKVK
jgi:membrane protein required for colicin V production